MNKRLLIAIITGAILGVFCVIGANVRYGGTLETSYIFSFWFNRFLMGVFFGLMPRENILWKRGVRGVLSGLFVGFAFYSSTEFLDLTGFLVSAVYGVIIEMTTHYFVKE